MATATDAVSAATAGGIPAATGAAGAAVTGTAARAATASAAAAVDATSAASASPAAHTGFALALDRIDYAIMVPLVYLSILALIVGVVWRVVAIMRAPAQPFSLRLYPAARRPSLRALGDTFGMPQVLKHSPLFWVFLMIFHVSFLLLILGHLDILPRINIMPPQSRDMLGSGLVGVGVTVPIMYFFMRRFRSPVREISTPADYLLLLLILFLMLFGDLMSWGNSWTPHGFVMTKANFSKYFDGLARFTFADPRAVLPGSHYHFAVIHVLLADLFFIVLPFTKIIHTFLSVPVNVLRRR